MHSRRLLSILLVLLLMLGALPALAQMPPILETIDVQYDTGLVDGEGQPLYQYAVHDMDIRVTILPDNGGVWIQTLNGFWHDPVRIYAWIDNNGAKELVPFVDSFGNEWLSLSGDMEHPAYYQLMVNGMLFMDAPVMASPLSLEEAVALANGNDGGDNGGGDIGGGDIGGGDNGGGDNGGGDNGGGDNGGGDNGGGDNGGGDNGGGDNGGDDWLIPPVENGDNNGSAATLSQPSVDPDLDDENEPPEYENPFGRTIWPVTQLYDLDLLPYIEVPEDTKFIVNETIDGALIYETEKATGKILLSVTSVDGLWNGYILADDFEFMTYEQEREYRDSLRETPPADRTSDYGRIRVANAALYSGVNVGYIDSLPSGSTMVYDTSRPCEYDANDALWLPVRSHDGKLSGYIPYSAFSFLDAQGEEDYKNGLKVPLPADSKNVFGRVTSASAEVFSDVGVSTGQSIAFGKVVEMLQSPEKHDANGNLYVPVKTEDGTLSGYVRMTDFRFMNDGELADYQASLNKEPDPKPMPDHQTDYAYIKSVGTTVHDRTGKQVGTISGNAPVVYQSAAQEPNFADAAGERWVLVKLDVDGGISGYVPVINLDFMTPREKEAYDKEKKDAENPPVVTDPTMDPGISRYAIILGDNVNVRSAPDGDKTNSVNKNEVVLVSREEIAANDTRYYYAELVQKTGKPMGYIDKRYVELMTPAAEAAYIASLKESESKPQKPATQVSGYYRVITSYALLMPFEDIGASPKAVLNAGDVVYVYEQVYDKSGNLFHNVLYGQLNQWGYILASSLTPMTPQEVNNHFKTSPPAVKPLQTAQPSAFSGYGVLTSSGVNFRNGASTSSTSHGRLSQGTVVRVLGQMQNGNETWYQCESGGVIGYIRGDLLSLLTIAQYQSLITSPSYNQNGSIITPTATIKPGSINNNTWATPRPNQTITFVTIPPSTTSPSPSPDPNATPTPNPFVTLTASPSTSPDGLIGDVSPSPDPDATLFPPDPDPSFPTEETSGFSPPGLLMALVVLLVIVAGGLYGYSVYNKARRKQSQEQAKRLADENRRRQMQPENGAKPAVRRPVPPVAPTSGTGPQGARPMGQATQPQPRVSDVTSPLPRAQVDGKPVNGAQKPPASQPQNPYARPQQPAATQRPRMPVAPPPVEPDNDEPNAATPRRRRRQDGAPRDDG